MTFYIRVDELQSLGMADESLGRVFSWCMTAAESVRLRFSKSSELTTTA